MSLEQQPFTPTRLEEDKIKDKGRTMGVWFSNEELKQLEEVAIWFHQPKESTTVKHCVEITRAILEGRDQIATFRNILFNNMRKNRRMGIEELDPRFRIS